MRMRFILYLRGVNESHLVWRPVNVFFSETEIMKLLSGQRLTRISKKESHCPVQIQ